MAGRRDDPTPQTSWRLWAAANFLSANSAVAFLSAVKRGSESFGRGCRGGRLPLPPPSTGSTSPYLQKGSTCHGDDRCSLFISWWTVISLTLFSTLPSGRPASGRSGKAAKRVLLWRIMAMSQLTNSLVAASRRLRAYLPDLPGHRSRHLWLSPTNPILSRAAGGRPRLSKLPARPYYEASPLDGSRCRQDPSVAHLPQNRHAPPSRSHLTRRCPRAAIAAVNWQMSKIQKQGGRSRGGFSTGRSVCRQAV